MRHYIKTACNPQSITNCRAAVGHVNTFWTWTYYAIDIRAVESRESVIRALAVSISENLKFGKGKMYARIWTMLTYFKFLCHIYDDWELFIYAFKFAHINILLRKEISVLHYLKLRLIPFTNFVSVKKCVNKCQKNKIIRLFLIS